MDFIVNNIAWVLLAVVSAAMLIWPMLQGKASGVRDVGTLEATQLINHENALLVDVREDKEFAAGHIPNARHIPLGSLPSRLKELEAAKSRPIIVNCRSGNRSASACGILRKNGFEKVYNLRGGINAWQQAGLPVEK